MECKSVLVHLLIQRMTSTYNHILTHLTVRKNRYFISTFSIFYVFSLVYYIRPNISYRISFLSHKVIVILECKSVLVHLLIQRMTSTYKHILTQLTVKKIYTGVFGVMLQNSPRKSKSPKFRLEEYQWWLWFWMIFVGNFFWDQFCAFGYFEKLWHD